MLAYFYKADQTEDEYGVIIRNLFQQNGIEAGAISGVIISSVVPTLRFPGKMAQKYFSLSPIIIGPGVKTGLNILYDNPEKWALTAL